MFKSDFKFIAKYFQTKRLNKTFKPTKDKIVYENELMKMFTALTGDKSFETAYNEVILTKKGGVTMCDVVERIRNEGRDEGKIELIRNLIESKAGTIEQIAAWVKLPVKEVKKIAQKVPVIG
jgi:predicted transposase YdaD